jgi:hypothetical protein
MASGGARSPSYAARMAPDSEGGADLSGASRAHTVDSNWLAARVAADTAARAATLKTLVPDLINYLALTGDHQDTLEIIDLGAGTGANQRWLAPQLPFRQRWVHLDHDPIISRSLPLPDDTMIIDDSVEALSRLLSRGDGRQLVTCSAVLDVLPMAQLKAVCRAVIDNRVPALFSLTVTGTLGVVPSHPDDQPLLDAFNDHQRRAGRAGPEAASMAAEALRAADFDVRCQETPWQLTAASGRAFVGQVLKERLHAAVSQYPGLAEAANAWLELRRSQLALGIMRVELGHGDILALPGMPWTGEIKNGAEITA